MGDRIKNILLASIPFIFILLIWTLFHYLDVFPQWLIPSPLQTASTFLELTKDGTLIGLLWASALNAIPAFLIALIFALLLGTLIGLNKTAKKIFFPFLSAIYPIPSLAWLPFIIIFFGFSVWTIWVVIFLSAFMKMIYSVIGGVRGVNQNWILAAKNFGLNKKEIIFNIILPGAFPQIVTGIRMGFGSAWRSLIGAEMLVVTLGGLGKFIWYAQWFFNFDKVFVGIMVIALVGIFIEECIFKKLEKMTIEKWGLIREDQ